MEDVVEEDVVEEEEECTVHRMQYLPKYEANCMILILKMDLLTPNSHD